MSFKLPDCGFVFWPVGSGDSTTICVDKDSIIQVDLHDTVSCEDDESPRVAIVDELVSVLPKKNKRPFLEVFVLTHPDKDHCAGFADLLKKVAIGELWFSPRVFREFKGDLCDDAKAFKKEALRRVKATVDGKGSVESGDRITVIGYDEILRKEDEYKDLPKDFLTVPGQTIRTLNGDNLPTSLRIFVHAPFKDDCDGERNDTSVGLQIQLTNSGKKASALLLGDLCYPTIKRIFDVSKKSDLAWNILLAPHHCSKSIMYSEDIEGKVVLQKELLTKIEEAAGDPGYIISSSNPIPKTNDDGDNPPHAIAKKRYEEIAPDGFFCTQEYPKTTAPTPMIFALTAKGLEFDEKGSSGKEGSSVGEAVKKARGEDAPPQQRVGFGQ